MGSIDCDGRDRKEVTDEIDCASFFDQIDDLIEFPPDNECENVEVGGDLVNSGNDIPSMWNEAPPNADNIFTNNSASDLSAELSVPYEEIAQLEWLSTFVEDSFAEPGLNLKSEIPCPNKKDPKDSKFQTSSPVSVLESSSSSSSNSAISSSIAKAANIPLCGTQRARSKRPRPPAFKPRPPIQLVETAPPTMVLYENLVESSSDSLTKKLTELSGPEPKKKKKSRASASGEGTQDGLAQAVRKCLHCEITKTPQWRAGPMGPKTLCNACGVRYKSGRLFPEYRPAASPTFVPAVHSNSHKKVLEMRNKAGHGAPLVNEKPKPKREPEDLVTE